jgi:cytochrome P450
VHAGPLERYIVEPIEVNGLQVSVMWDMTLNYYSANITKVPPGIIASTAAYDQGRLASVCSEPQKWQPDRWLEATDEMHLNWTPFGHGTRSCPGSNFAMTELKYMVGTILRLYQVEPPKQHQPKPLDLGDVFVSGERSGACWLRFSDIR